MVTVTDQTRAVFIEKGDNSRKNLERILEPIAPEMKKLGDGINRFIGSLYGDFFPEAQKLAAGGKRLRGAICISSAKVQTGDTDLIDRAIAVAADVEGIHLASLLHDDIIDGASERRGIATLHERYGRTGAILAGDLIYVKIFRNLLDFNDNDLIRAVTDGTADMVEGETLETVSAVLGLEPSIDDYFRCIGKKTASFFRASAMAGTLVGSHAMASDKRKAIVETMGRFGHDLGMVFQIVDDILDWSADPEAVGKSLLSDIRNAKLTLPLLHFLEDDSAAARVAIDRAMEGEIAPLSSELSRRGYLQRAHRAAQGYADSAYEALSGIDGETEVLKEILNFSLNRNC